MQRPHPRAVRCATWFIACALLSLSGWYIVRSFQWHEIGGVLKKIKLEYFLIGGCLSILSYWLARALRWNVLLKSLHIKIPLIDIYLCTAFTLSLSIFTPIQSGEMLKVELMKKHGLIERLPGYGSFLVERVMDLGVVAFLALCGTLLYGGLAINISVVAFLLLVLMVALVLIILLLHKFPGLLKAKLIMVYQLMRGSFISPKVFTKVLLLTFVGWCLTAIGWQMCLYSLSIDLGTFRAIALTSVVTLIGILSFIPGAVGISEAGTASLLIYFGHGVPSAQAGALILRSYSLLIVFLGAIHLAVWLFVKKVRMKLPRPVCMSRL